MASLDIDPPQAPHSPELKDPAPSHRESPLPDLEGSGPESGGTRSNPRQATPKGHPPRKRRHQGSPRASTGDRPARSTGHLGRLWAPSAPASAGIDLHHSEWDERPAASREKRSFGDTTGTGTSGVMSDIGRSKRTQTRALARAETGPRSARSGPGRPPPAASCSAPGPPRQPTPPGGPGCGRRSPTWS